MDLNLDLRNKKAISVQLFEALYSQIKSQQLQPGDQLPTVRELANQYDINFNTVARAYRLLEGEGVITTRQGRGTFVCKRDELNDRTGEQIIQDVVDQLEASIHKAAERNELQPEWFIQALLTRFGQLPTVEKPITKISWQRQKKTKRSLSGKHFKPTTEAKNKSSRIKTNIKTKRHNKVS